MVGLVQHAKPAKMVCLTGHGPVGVKGRRGSRVPEEFHGLKGPKRQRF